MSGPCKLHVLLCASGCDGGDVGEPWSTYQWASRLAQHHVVTLLTFQHRINAPPTVEPPGVEVVKWNDLSLFGRFERFNSTFKPGYPAFYLRARSWIKSALRRGRRFDIAHQLSPLAIRYWSPCAALGIPMILGPLGGSVSAPPAFDGELNTSSWYTRLRAFDQWRLRHDPLLRRSLSSADVVIGVAPYVKQVLADVPLRRFAIMGETGPALLPPERSRVDGTPGRLRLLFVGRAVRSKGLRDAIRMMARLDDLPQVSLDVIGDGDDMAFCRAEALAIKGANRVRFHGRLPRQEVDKFYEGADVFVFPSLREASGNVVLEAMSHGLAMVVADAGGPGYVVSDECGYRIAPRDPEQFPDELAAAVRNLAADPPKVRQMGRAARARVAKHYLWDQKVNWMSQLYHEVAGAAYDVVPSPTVTAAIS